MRGRVSDQLVNKEEHLAAEDMNVLARPASYCLLPANKHRFAKTFPYHPKSAHMVGVGCVSSLLGCPQVDKLKIILPFILQFLSLLND